MNEPANDTTTASDPEQLDPQAHSDSRIPERIAEAGTATYQRGSDRVDDELVDKTRHQIRTLVSEIAEIAKSECEPAEFFEGFLVRTTSALASDGGAVWLDESKSGQLALQYHVNMDQTCLADDAVAQKRHSLLLNKIRESGEPSLVPPNSGAPGEDQPGNPTGNLLIIGPLVVHGETLGLVEIFQRPGAGPATQRGYLRFLKRMSDLASDYLTGRQIDRFQQQQTLWNQLDEFVRAIHSGLDPAQTAYVIANEGRRIIDSDRVSIVLGSGNRCQIKAVSGLDSIERRADQIKLLQKLSAVVIRTGEPLWYAGEDEDLSPQIERRLHDYVDKSHTKMLAIIPLDHHTQPEPDQPADAKQESTGRQPLGALIVEQLKDSTIEPTMRRRIDVVSQHSQSALANAIEHNSLFLMPLWRSLGKLARPFSSTQLPKTMLVIGLLASVIAFFALFPWTFTLSADGQLKPRSQREVFAQIDGILQEVHVPPDDTVAVRKGDVLARMDNNDLIVQIRNLEGQINQANEQIRMYRKAQSERLEKVDQIMLEGELLKAQQSLASLQRELAIKQQQAEQLIVRSPADGIVINWQVRQNLLRRPVDRGQNLMTVVDPDGGWELELEVPERRLGHLLRRIKSDERPVEVNFALVSHPGSEFTGRLLHVDEKLEVYSEDGNSARAIVAFDNNQIPADLLKSGTRINAQLQCGTRSIGYVWFHELFETVDTAWRYWF